MRTLLIFVALPLGSPVLTSAQTYQVLYTFTGTDYPDAQGRLLLGSNTLYGTTTSGGASGWGAIYAIRTNGLTYRVLTNFAAAAIDAAGADTNYGGVAPYTGLVTDGSLLHGTTYQAGSGSWGTVFSLHLDGPGLTALNNF